MNKDHYPYVSSTACSALMNMLVNRLDTIGAVYTGSLFRSELRALFELARLTPYTKNVFECVYLEWLYGLK